jgi:hypothetical protein
MYKVESEMPQAVIVLPISVKEVREEAKVTLPQASGISLQCDTVL